MDTDKPILKIKRAWIMTWEWMSDSASLVDSFAGIINYRKSEKYVVDLVEFLYNLKTANLSELASYAKNHKSVPYKAAVDFNFHIACGGHPLLLARQVKNIEVFVDPGTNIETITWETFPTYRPSESGPEKVSESKKEGLTRIVTGPLSFDDMWDRVKGKFKDMYLIQS